MATSMCRALSLLRQPKFHCPARINALVRAESLPFQCVGVAHTVWKIQAATYAKKAGKGAKSVEPKEIMQVSTDPDYLTSRCSGANFFKEGEDVRLGPDETYPDWLWALHTGPPPPLEELPRDTPQYWRKLRKMHMRRNNRLEKMKKF